ncbi:MAG: SBBP repeat-containing protein, partial [bacterium]
GRFKTTVDFDPGPDVYNRTSHGEYDIFLSKCDSAGNFIWAKTWGGDKIDEGHGVAADGSGNAYVTGCFRETADFNPGPGVDNRTSNGGNDIFLSKFDSTGKFIWAKTLGSTGYDDGNSVALDISGNAYMTGSFSGTVDFDTGPGIDNHISENCDDVFLSKFAPE